MQAMSKKQNHSCCGGSCGPPPKNLNRRGFLATSGAGTAALLAARVGLPVMAGPFEPEDIQDHPIPVDKKLDPTWVRNLFAPGEPEIYRGWDQLKHIGMPVGGIGAGTMYLGGDGRLWVWDIFNSHHEGVVPQTIADFQGRRVRERDGANYVNPPTSSDHQPVKQGFVVRIGDQSRTLDVHGFQQVSFHGQYPIGTVSYDDDDSPVSVQLEAFSPFIPLNTDDSSLPATVMNISVSNKGDRALNAEVTGILENAVLHDHRGSAVATLRNQVVQEGQMLAVISRAEKLQSKEPQRPDIVFETFEGENYQGWDVEGTAFSDSPIAIADIPVYQGDVGGKGDKVVNSHNVRQGGDVAAGDRHVGKMTSELFTIERKFINFLIGGGNHPGETCLNLLVDGQVVRTAAGRDDNRMRGDSFNVSPWIGKQAQLQIVDQVSGGWGNIGLDHIVFSDQPRSTEEIDDMRDFGTLALALVDPQSEDQAGAAVNEKGRIDRTKRDATATLGETLTGGISREMRLEPGQTATATFVITWHFPNLKLNVQGGAGRWYASKFASAREVAAYVAAHFKRLAGDTRAWRDTWYDSTLPYWLLNRTFANASSLATQTCFRLANGRFWAWEGIGCCPGTCTHVWHYAQAVGRLFPDLERDLRERTDFGIGFDTTTGRIRFRGENNNRDAADGQAGVIMRSFREHQMSADNAFLQRNWKHIKRALQWMIDFDAADGAPDGMITGEQHNTLDAEWFGKIPVIASLYLSALRCGQEMAQEMGDDGFARTCQQVYERGREEIEMLFNGEYLVQQEHPDHLDAIGVGKGCYIDQVFGQGWAFQVGLGRLFDEKVVRSSLQALWKYNFNPDMGPLRDSLEPKLRGRPYAIAGDAGLVMCTWPKGGKRDDWERFWQFGYFNECMSGFEYQAAGHMIWESSGDDSLLMKGLAIARAIHDRYHAVQRNPYNEIECSDHYARAMASYGVFLAACGYEHHGPKGHLAFAPRLRAEDFKAPFTAAEGWGSFEQQVRDRALDAKLTVNYGRVRLATLALASPHAVGKATINGQEVGFKQDGDRVLLSLERPEVVLAGQSLQVKLVS